MKCFFLVQGILLMRFNGCNALVRSGWNRTLQMSELCLDTQLEIYGSSIGVPQLVFCEPYAGTINFHPCIRNQPNIFIDAYVRIWMFQRTRFICIATPSSFASTSPLRKTCWGIPWLVAFVIISYFGGLSLECASMGCRILKGHASKPIDRWQLEFDVDKHLERDSARPWLPQIVCHICGPTFLLKLWRIS